MSAKQKTEKALPSVFQGTMNYLDGCWKEERPGVSAGHDGRRGMRDGWLWSRRSPGTGSGGQWAVRVGDAFLSPPS